MSPNPTITLFATANRPELWMKFYGHVSRNDTPLELVFVGNVAPEFDLPSNFRFIYSTVKPSQCSHIALINSKGRYMINVSDDYTFNDNAFDKMLDECKKDERNIVSPLLLSHTGEKIPQGFWEDKGPILPASSFASQALWHKIGDIDKRFIGVFWDIDMAMAAWASNAKIVICEEATLYERNARGLKGRLCCINADRNFLYSCWHETGNPETGGFLPKRKDAVQKFAWTNDILEVSQGTLNNRWT